MAEDSTPTRRNRSTKSPSDRHHPCPARVVRLHLAHPFGGRDRKPGTHPCREHEAPCAIPEPASEHLATGNEGALESDRLAQRSDQRVGNDARIHAEPSSVRTEDAEGVCF